MKQIKLFKATGAAVEHSVNSWIREYPQFKILDIKISRDFIMVIYES